ncbi:aldo/keto reductase [Lederbergia citri]|uniref:Aldo/keto reductase n=1 Tax=Lederbergia citri TaxID=2833580 RepID=A0A942TEM3_9BACI|nr:aldo/keto reductase [Lederbergia citri]MBS4196485.1 aldo/keto reductase [Lederbergia citri]
MEKRKLRDLEVSAVGFGAMGFSHGYGPAPEKNEAIKLMRQAFDLGCTFFDTAEGYGNGENERLVGEALKPIRNQVVLATKFRVSNEEAHSKEQLEKSIRNHIEASLKRLGTDYIDLYYQHRINKDIPVEDIAYVMGKLIKEGIILGWGQSQSTVDEIRRAHAVTPLTAIQSEYSIMERMFERDVIPLCKELRIGFVPFSPLASGFLSGKVSVDTHYVGDDVRRVITRFDKENIHANQPLLDLITSFAEEKGATPAQISLAWMLHKKDFIVPIPGSRKIERIKENLGAAKVILTKEEFEQIELQLAKIKIHGNRTDEDIAKLRFKK